MSAMRSLFRHPLVLIGIGAAAGYYAHKYRKEIIAAVSQATDMGKDYVLGQKENLEDILEETREETETGVTGNPRAVD